MKPTPPRNDKIDADRARIIVEAVRDGNYLETAASLAGVTRDTLRSWLRRGADESDASIYGQFHRAVLRAEAESERAILTRIEAAGVVDWKADAWRLERRHASRWASRARLDVAVTVEAKRQAAAAVVEAVRGRMSPGAFRELVEALASEDDEEIDVPTSAADLALLTGDAGDD